MGSDPMQAKIFKSKEDLERRLSSLPMPGSVSIMSLIGAMIVGRFLPQFSANDFDPSSSCNLTVSRGYR